MNLTSDAWSGLEFLVDFVGLFKEASDLFEQQGSSFSICSMLPVLYDVEVRCALDYVSHEFLDALNLQVFVKQMIGSLSRLLNSIPVPFPLSSIPSTKLSISFLKKGGKRFTYLY